MHFYACKTLRYRMKAPSAAGFIAALRSAFVWEVDGCFIAGRLKIFTWHTKYVNTYPMTLSKIIAHWNVTLMCFIPPSSLSETLFMDSITSFNLGTAKLYEKME